MSTPKVFLSSTWVDLKSHRKAVLSELRGIDSVQVVCMEDFAAQNAPSKNASLEKLKDCALYIGLFGWRYGSRAEDGRSITEHEYDFACANGMDRFLFVADNGFPINPDHEEPDEARQRQRDLRARVGNDRIPKSFGASQDRLAASVVVAVANWLMRYRVVTGVAPASLHQLPSDLSDFTGRGKEVDDLIAALGGKDGGAAAVSAIRGMGGIGKTTLAVHAARQLLHRYPDAQILVNLQGHSEAPALTPTEIMAQVVCAFHPEMKVEDDPQRMEAAYRSVLAGRQALIILDNAADTVQVEKLVPPPPCGLIVTAREPVHLDGAVPLRLGLLLRGESIALLRSAARPAQATEEEWDRIADLCDDLPLALRVAGAFLAHAEDCSAADYIADLTDAQNRLDHLKVNGKTRGDVGAVLAHSARRLAENDPALAALWQCLSVFPADFDRPAAAAVWRFKEEKDAATSLRALLERGLLLYEADSKRYRLHDLMRPLARDVFTAAPDKDPAPGTTQRLDKAQAAFALHYMYVLETADNLFKNGNEDVITGLRIYDRESGNISATAEWAIKQQDANRVALNIAMCLPNSGIDILSLRLSPKKRIRVLEAALKAARSLGQKRLEGCHLGNLGTAHFALGEIERAIEYHELGLAISREFSDQHSELRDLASLGNASGELGMTTEALSHLDQALAIAREIDDHHSEGKIHGSIGNIYASLGDTKTAIKYHSQALIIARKLGDRRSEGVSLGNLGNAHAALDKKRRAMDCFEKALIIAREIGDWRLEGNCLFNLGEAYSNVGKVQRAIALIGQALTIFNAIESPHVEKAQERLAELHGILNSA